MQFIFEESFHILLWPLSWVYWLLKYMQSALLPKIVLINIHQLINQDNRSMPSHQHKSQTRWDRHSIHTILNLVTTIHTLMFKTQKNSNAITQDIIYGKGHMDRNPCTVLLKDTAKTKFESLIISPAHRRKHCDILAIE